MVDENHKKTMSGQANWIFVPLSERNKEKVADIAKRSLSLRLLKFRHLYKQMKTIKQQASKDKKRFRTLKLKIQNFNKLLLTINEDLLDRFVFRAEENALNQFKIVHKVIDFAPAGADQHSRDFVVRLQRIVDNNGILIDWPKSSTHSQ